MKGHRPKRVGSLIKEEMTQIINKSLEFIDHNSLISVTKVLMSNDLSYATVYVSIFAPNPEEKIKLFEFLNEKRFEYRKNLGSKIRIRHIPELRFKDDDSIEYGAKIEKILHNIKKEESNEGI